MVSVETLRLAMNEVWAGRQGSVWRGELLPGLTATGGDPNLVREMTRRGPWIAHLRCPDYFIGHYVVVAALSAEEVLEILDPSPGTVYAMTVPAFLACWNGQAVHLVPPS